MQKCRIEPYQPPRATLRELMEGRAAGTDDEGIPPMGYLGGPPKLPRRLTGVWSHRCCGFLHGVARGGSRGRSQGRGRKRGQSWSAT